MQEIKNISIYKQSLKDKILETSMRMFQEKGIRAVKMDDIANKLSISKRTLYEIYDDKERLLFEGVKRFHNIRQEQLRKVSIDSDNVMDVILYAYKQHVESFRHTNPMFYSDMEKYPKILKFFEQENENSHVQFVDFLRRGVNEGFFRDDVNYDIVACMFDALGKFVMSKSLYHRYSMEDLMSNIIFVSLRGFCTQRGADVLDLFLKNKQ